MKANDRVRLQDILDSIEKIEKHVKGLNRSRFEFLFREQDAVEWRLIIIGEAVAHLSSAIKRDFNSVPWRDVVGMRDKIIHENGDTDAVVVWETIKKDLPPLKKEILKFLQKTK